MEKIKALRMQIDQADDEIMELLARRFQLSQEVIAEKELRGLGPLDARREEDIIKKAQRHGEKVVQVYRELLRISKEKP